MEESLISVIVPVYNVEKYLGKCIDSILNQTYRNIEVILVDDGSPDDCGKICDEYAKRDNRIIVIHKENGGLSDARNKGIDIAKGEYITFIDSDDYVESTYIETLYEALKKFDCKMSICSHTVVYENKCTKKLETNENRKIDKIEVLKRILYSDGIDLSAWAKLYSKELFNNVRFPKGRLFEDSATTYKLICQCDSIACHLVSRYNYFIRNGSITTKTFNLKKMDLITSTNEMCDYIEEKYPELKKAALRRRVYAYLSTITQLAKCKENYLKEQKEMMRFIRKNSFSVLSDINTPKRDKIGIISLFFGFKFYKFSWRLYEKITGRV